MEACASDALNIIGRKDGCGTLAFGSCFPRIASALLSKRADCCHWDGFLFFALLPGWLITDTLFALPLAARPLLSICHTCLRFFWWRDANTHFLGETTCTTRRNTHILGERKEKDNSQDLKHTCTCPGSQDAEMMDQSASVLRFNLPLLWWWSP